MAKLTNAQSEILNVVAAKTQAGEVHYVTEKNGKKLVELGLITVDFDNSDGEGYAAQATEAGMIEVFGDNETNIESNSEISDTTVDDTVADNSEAGVQAFKPMTGVVIPAEEQKRRTRTGRYPWATLEVGSGFYVPNTSVRGGDAYKALGSGISTIERASGKETGEFKTRKQTQKDEAGNPVLGKDGKPMKVDVQVPVIEKTVRYQMDRVTAGKQYGEWTCPADGVYVSRVA